MANYFRPGTYALVPNKHLLPQMKGAPLSVYITLCGHADDNGVCFPGIQRICDTTGYDRTTVFRALKVLIALGVIERHNRTAPSGDPDSNLYRILLSDYPQGSGADATTPSHTRHHPRGADATTPSGVHATRTNPSELTQVRNKGNDPKAAAAAAPLAIKRFDEPQRDGPSPIAERIRETIKTKGVRALKGNTDILRHSQPAGANSDERHTDTQMGAEPVKKAVKTARSAATTPHPIKQLAHAQP